MLFDERLKVFVVPPAPTSFVLFQHVFSTYPSLSLVCTPHYHLIKLLHNFLVILLVIISVFLTSLSVWCRCHSFLFCRQDFLNFLWEILFINSLFKTLFKSLKNQQISERIAPQCLLYTSKDFAFPPNQCSSTSSLVNTKRGKYVGRTCRIDKDFVLERKGIG